MQDLAIIADRTLSSYDCWILLNLAMRLGLLVATRLNGVLLAAGKVRE